MTVKKQEEVNVVEFEPVTGCRTCRVFSRPGMHHYMLGHMRRAHRKYRQEHGRMEVAGSRALVEQTLVTNGDLNTAEKDKGEDTNSELDVDSICNQCDMVFVDETTLESHVEEIHEEHINKFSVGFMIMA